MKDLTISNIERQNVLNNCFAVSKIREHLNIEGMLLRESIALQKRWLLIFTK